MKKFLALATLFALAGCGSGSADSDAQGNYKLARVGEGCQGTFAPEVEVVQSGSSVSVSSDGSGSSSDAGLIEGSSSNTSGSGTTSPALAVNVSKNVSVVEASPIEASGSVAEDGGFVASGDDIQCSGKLDAAGGAPTTLECQVPGSSCTLTYELVGSTPASSN